MIKVKLGSISLFAAVIILIVALAHVLGADDERRDRELLQRTTERLRQQIRTHHGVDARVVCTNGSDVRDFHCVAVIRDVTTYFRCERHYEHSLCMPVNGGAR